MNFDNTAQVDALAALPPEPPKRQERGIWKTAVDSLRGAGAKAMASAVEVGRVVGPAVALASDPNDAQALEAVKAPIDFGQNELSKPFRDFERTLRPDPATAGKAEQIVYGAVGPLASLVGAAVVGGPAGIVAASGEMGFSAAEDLRREGVDLGTRTAVGALTAGVNIAGAALPLAGQTLKSTAGLYLLGGPGAFMAQQQATRSILERANYGELAKQYDPLDPTGLLVSSLVPLPFAAAGAVRNVRAMRPASQPKAETGAPAREAPSQPKPEAAPPAPAHEVVDAAMAHNLTVLHDGQQAVPPVARAAEVMRGPVTENPNFRAWFGESKVVDNAGKPLVLYHGTASSFDEFSPAALQAEGIHLSASPEVASTFAASRAMDGGRGANVQPVYVRAERVKDVEFVSTDSIQQARAEGFDAVRRGDHVVVMDPTQVKSAIGNSGRFDPSSPSLTDSAPPPAPTPAKPSMFGDLSALKDSPDVALRNVAKGLELAAPDVARIMDTAAASPKLLDLGAAMSRAVQDFAAAKASGQVVDMPAEISNLVTGLRENARSPERVAAMVKQLADELATIAPGDKSTTAADVTANAVERLRSITDAQLTDTPPETIKASTDPLMRSIAERVQAVEAAAGDLTVRMDDSGQRITVADELARIRREAAEGTDVELGALDADLVRIAAECALSTGAM